MAALPSRPPSLSQGFIGELLVQEHCYLFQEAAYSIGILRVPARLRWQPEAVLPVRVEVAVGLVWESLRGIVDPRLVLRVVIREFHSHLDGRGNAAIGLQRDCPLKKNAPGLLVDPVGQAGKCRDDSLLVLCEAYAPISLVPGFRLRLCRGAPVQSSS